VFIVSDQGFPPGLVPASGGCVIVMRQEYGSINELCDMFIEHTRGCIIPAGSIVMLSSLTHLADVGVGAYTEDLCAGLCSEADLWSCRDLSFPPLEDSWTRG
jgi:hypothetical protein